MNPSSTPARELRIVPGLKRGYFVVVQAPASDESRERALKFWPAWDGFHPHTFCSSRKGAERVLAERSAA